MSIVVQKFGGSSVADKEKLYNVANIISKTHDEGNSVVVVVSAQGKTTDGLMQKANEIENSLNNKREMDVLLSTGEQITISLLCMVLESLGKKAVSFTGWQLPIITDNNHTNAKIKCINNDRILQKLNQGYIVVIAGFQGIDEHDDITTLGRGGSDTTAVAIAASLKADKCEIYTDVDGVFATDPRIVKNAEKINEISYDEMLELASSGAKVLHNRCVEIGKNNSIDIYVKSSLKKGEGTVVKENNDLEKTYIRGVAKDDNVARVAVLGVENKIGKTYKIFDLLAKQGINIDIIVQSGGEHFQKDVYFTTTRENVKKVLEILKSNMEEIGARDIRHREDLSKISVVGVGMINNPGVASKMFEALYENNINMHMISTSDIKISVLVNFEDADVAVKAIHDKFFIN